MKLVIWLRSFFGALVYIPYLLLASFICVACNLIFNSRKVDDFVVAAWAKISCKLFGVNVEVIGMNIWKRNGGAVVLFNHSSFFDIFALMGYLPGIRFGAKIELFKIPLFGLAMRRVGILPIDRGAREKTLRVYEKSLNRLRAGDRVALAPEGTRNSHGGLKKFKGGPFIFALQAQVPIIPVVVNGAAEILPKHAKLPNAKAWSRTITLEVLEPVQTAGIQDNDMKALQDNVFAIMLPKVLS